MKYIMNTYNVFKLLAASRITYSQMRWIVQSAKCIKNKRQPTIGLEIHAQIAAESKLFSGAATQFGGPINSQVAPMDAAIPGTLPVLNKRCVEAAMQVALALNCHINMVSMFDRKHYFYADLPAGFQITQQRQPIARGGDVEYVTSGSKHRHKLRTAKITQVQLEQDSGKSLHDTEAGVSLIDLNRAGMALLEIVTEPDFTSAEEAAAFVKELRLILTTIGSCDGKMSEGSLRVDASVSLHYPDEPLGVRTEVKNLNSIRFIAKAIEHEIERQTAVLDAGGQVNNETRSFDPDSGKTIPMRDKEKIHDYRFMPEPNLPPLRLSNADINDVKAKLPELPWQQRHRLVEKGLPLEKVHVIVNEPGMVELFDSILEADSKRNPETVVNLMLNEILTMLNKGEMPIGESVFTSQMIGDIVDLVDNELISHSTLKKILLEICGGCNISVKDLVAARQWMQESDRTRIHLLCEDAILHNPKTVKKYLKGKKKVFTFLVGQVLRDSDDTANVRIVTEILKEKLEYLQEKAKS